MKLEENSFSDFFYGEVLGVKPTSTCVCSDKEIEESRFIRHVKKTTILIHLQMVMKSNKTEHSFATQSHQMLFLVLVIKSNDKAQ